MQKAQSFFNDTINKINNNITKNLIKEILELYEVKLLINLSRDYNLGKEIASLSEDEIRSGKLIEILQDKTILEDLKLLLEADREAYKFISKEGLSSTMDKMIKEQKAIVSQLIDLSSCQIIEPDQDKIDVATSCLDPFAKDEFNDDMGMSQDFTKSFPEFTKPIINDDTEEAKENPYDKTKETPEEHEILQEGVANVEQNTLQLMLYFYQHQQEYKQWSKKPQGCMSYEQMLAGRVRRVMKQLIEKQAALKPLVLENLKAKQSAKQNKKDFEAFIRLNRHPEETTEETVFRILSDGVVVKLLNNINYDKKESFVNPLLKKIGISKTTQVWFFTIKQKDIQNVTKPQIPATVKVITPTLPETTVTALPNIITPEIPVTLEVIGPKLPEVIETQIINEQSQDLAIQDDKRKNLQKEGEVFFNVTKGAQLELFKKLYSFYREDKKLFDKYMQQFKPYQIKKIKRAFRKKRLESYKNYFLQQKSREKLSVLSA